MKLKTVFFLICLVLTSLCIAGDIKVGEFKLIYNPSVGEKEPWYINDHCFIYDKLGQWHLFGITRQEPMSPADEDNFAHATSGQLTAGWQKQPFALTTDPNIGEAHLWAPYVIEHNGLYYMYYCAGGRSGSEYQIKLATSKDLFNWQRHPENPMFIDGIDARDPFILRLKNKWVMYYTATSDPKGGNHVVFTQESTDLIKWGNKKTAFTDPSVGTFGGPTESPFVVRRGKFYYLFIGPRDDYRGTCVYKSKNPFEFKIENLVAKINSHAAEVIRDTDGNWFVSHCGWGQGGVWLAPLQWNDGVSDNDTSMPVPQKTDAPKQISKNSKKFKKISVADYRDKMTTGWLGQMVGVTWGYPTEFKWNGKIVPEANVPQWLPKTINDAFWQDDLYVEMTFLSSMQKYGFDVSPEQAGIDFANTKFELWHANKFGRDNLRKGIAPPDSGHPKFNQHADDIDYQIEADYAGLISPGMPNFAVELGNKFGSIMNYGDGLYGGLFVSAMYSEAFFEKDINKIILNALEYIPAESQYAEIIRDVIKWHNENPQGWEKTWQLIDEKYQKNADYRKFSCYSGDGFNIDAKINGAYIVMGLLYGKGNIEETIKISMRCGHDSDCNPSNAAGVLFTTIGYKNLPEQYKQVDMNLTFDHTNYDISSLFDVCEVLARRAVYRNGGFTEKGCRGDETFVIAVSKPTPEKLQQCWQPDEIVGNKYTQEQLKQITEK